VDTLAGLLEEIPESLAAEAVTHASWVERRSDSWDRLAFLGDVVLGLAVSSDIYPRFPQFGAGRLTKLRAQAVSRAACAEVARELGLVERVLAAAPPGRDATGLVRSDRILASVCEAVIGAAYLTFGFDRVAPAVVAAFADQVEESLSHPVDFKSVFQERLTRRGAVVVYRIESEEGPAHERCFVAVAEVEGAVLGRGEGRTKKAAEQEAALEALAGEGGVRGEDRPLADPPDEDPG
jgi:ribonuclease III